MTETTPVQRHPGPWTGTDADLARACAIAAIRDYGTDEPETHQRIMTSGVWNDHVAVQAALAAIYNLREDARKAADAPDDDDNTMRDDPMFNRGVQHVVDMLAKTIGATGWVAGDGSEDYDTDLAQTLLNILAARGLFDADAGEIAEPERLRAECDRLRQLISRPYIGAWTTEILIEAAHQRERWGAQHDTGKSPEDWFWLIGYLAGKALAAHKAGDLVKARHHTVSTGAVLAHWAASIGGNESVFRPGLGPEQLAGIVDAEAAAR